MARARGANAVMAAVFEASYGVTPGSGLRKLPFVSANLGEEQSLIESDLLGYGRDPLTPAYDVVSNESDIVVPMDHRNIGTRRKSQIEANSYLYRGLAKTRETARSSLDHGGLGNERH